MNDINTNYEVGIKGCRRQINAFTILVRKPFSNVHIEDSE